MSHPEMIALLRAKYQALAPVLDQRARRYWAASEAKALGWGGVSAVSEATGISRTTIRSGLCELEPAAPDHSLSILHRGCDGRAAAGNG